MDISRRNFIAVTGAGALGAALASGSLGSIAFASGQGAQIKAVAFDAFPIFDPRPAFAVLKQQFPEKGDELQKAWFAKIFGYTWLRTTAGQYQNFTQVMEEALIFTAKSMQLQLTPEKQSAIISAFSQLPVWPDVLPALQKLRQHGIRLAFLSNMQESMLRANMRYNNIEEYFEFTLSTDAVQQYKPSPKAYQLAVDSFKLKKEEIAFAAFAGWDAAGAAWFGYPTVWVNRINSPAEELGITPAATGSNISALLTLLKVE